MRKSTSLHTLNADKGLGSSGKRLWLLLNMLNNGYFPRKTKHIATSHFCPTISRSDWYNLSPTCSPARALSDLFWAKLDWSLIKSELGPLCIVDAGAGKGSYALKLHALSGGVSSYCGLDITAHDEWSGLMNQYDFIHFEQCEADNLFHSIPPSTNFIMSQSAIEHFDNDLLYFHHIERFVSMTKRNTIQIHLFPSRACLNLYRWHGVRQYTPRTASLIADVFNSSQTYSILYALGGNTCNRLHYNFITKPWLIGQADLRDALPSEYNMLLKQAIEHDISNADSDPTFYALAIHSNFDRPIFRDMSSLNASVTS